MMRKFAWLFSTAVISAAALPAAAAASPSATVQAQGEAKLQPNGSALVTVTYSCMPGTGAATGELTADLEQPQAFGFTSVNVTCDDANHTITLNELPGPFVRGEASLDVQLFAPNATAQDQIEVNVD